jgi:hypothetical protein
MAVELIIKVTTPLDEDDQNLLSGTAVMLLAIANHELAKERFPETFPTDEEPAKEGAGPEPLPDPTASGTLPN